MAWTAGSGPVIIAGAGRPRGYNHHGIYVSDNRVIQFGSGITLTGKSRTGIDAVPLNDFENGGTAKVVRHGTPRWITGGYDPPADDAWKIVERGEFLLRLQPRLPYHLIAGELRVSVLANRTAISGTTMVTRALTIAPDSNRLQTRATPGQAAAAGRTR